MVWFLVVVMEWLRLVVIMVLWVYLSCVLIRRLIIVFGWVISFMFLVMLVLFGTMVIVLVMGCCWYWLVLVFGFFCWMIFRLILVWLFYWVIGCWIICVVVFDFCLYCWLFFGCVLSVVNMVVFELFWLVGFFLGFCCIFVCSFFWI